MKLRNIEELNLVTQYFGEDRVKESLDTLFHSNTDELTIYRGHIGVKFIMSSLFPTSNRKQAYKHFAHYSGITI